MKYEELAKVNVNEHIEKKQNLSYLSWAWAVDYMSRLDESAEWEYREWDGKPYLILPDESCMVYCTVTFGGKKKTAHLPVLDHANRPIKNPNAFQINTTMQRALVKAIALHGLGLYIYAGEDLPKDEADKQPEEKAVQKATLGSKASPTSDAKSRLTATQVTKVMGVVSAVTDWLNSGSVADAVMETENAGMDADEAVFFWTHFDSKQRSAMKKENEVQRKKLQERELATQA